MMPQPDDRPTFKFMDADTATRLSFGTWTASERSTPRTFEAYDGDKLIAYGDEDGVHYLSAGAAWHLGDVLHRYGRSLLNSRVPSEGVGFVLREGERYSGAV